MPDSTYTFSDYLSRYLRETSHRVINRTDCGLANHVMPFVGHMTLAEISPKTLSTMRDRLKLRGYSNQTVKHVLGLVSRVYSAAEKDWFVWEGDNPVKRVRKPSVAHTGRNRVIHREEVVRITRWLCQSHAAYVWVAYETGMRRGEIERIRPEHLDAERRTLRIPTTKTGYPRTIPLSQNALLWLGRLLAEPMPPGDGVGRAFRGAADKARIRGVRFHDLRHSAVTRFFELGLNVMEVATISGHRTVAMLARYTHLSPEKLVDRLN